MIPKKIHYCWFGGGELSESAKKCMESWRKYCPDYEIVEWNETRFDVRQNRYVKEAYEAGKWAFIADMVRLYALVTEGGVYLDTDVELVRSLDESLRFSAVLGFEGKRRLSTAFMATEPSRSCFRAMLSEYRHLRFVREDGSLDMTTNVERMTAFFALRGLRLNGKRQSVAGVTILPTEYFSPKDFDTGVLRVTEKTVCIHHFEGTWLDSEERAAMALKRRYAKYMPQSWAGRFGKFASIVKHRGVGAALKETALWATGKVGK